MKKWAHTVGRKDVLCGGKSRGGATGRDGTKLPRWWDAYWTDLTGEGFKNWGDGDALADDSEGETEKEE